LTKLAPSTDGARGRIVARPALMAVLALGVAACDTAGGSAPGAVSEGEAAQLDEIAEELDQRKLPPEAIPALNEAGNEPTEVTGDTE